MGEEIKQLFTSGDSAHKAQAKQMARSIWEHPSDVHDEMVETIKETLIKFHQIKIDSIKKS